MHLFLGKYLYFASLLSLFFSDLCSGIGEVVDSSNVSAWGLCRTILEHSSKLIFALSFIMCLIMCNDRGLNCATQIPNGPILHSAIRKKTPEPRVSLKFFLRVYFNYPFWCCPAAVTLVVHIYVKARESKVGHCISLSFTAVESNRRMENSGHFLSSEKKLCSLFTRNQLQPLVRGGGFILF